MSRETEKLFRKMHESIDSSNMTEEEYDAAVQEFIKKSNNGELKDLESDYDRSMDLLDRALDEKSDARARKLAKEALDIWPRNVDAAIFLAGFQPDRFKYLDEVNRIIKKEKRALTNEGFFNEEYIGDFWGIVETRPYMRALRTKYDFLKEELNRYTEAIELAEEMIRLNEDDNIGMRFELMGLYALLDRFDDVVKLYNHYKEEDIMMMLPYAVMLFRKGDYTEMKKVIRSIKKENKHIFKMLKDLDIPDEDPEMYSLGTPEEAAIAAKMNLPLLLSTPAFLLMV